MDRKYLGILLLILMISLFNSISTQEDHEKRLLESIINPDCKLNECRNPVDNSTSDLSIVYVKSSKFKNEKKKGPDLHFILSTYEHNPAIFIVSTKNDSNLNIDWHKLMNNEADSVQFLNEDKKTSLKKNTIGILIDKIFFWLDNEKGDANYDPNSSETKIIDSLIWRKVELLTQSDDNVHVQFELKNPVYNGIVKIKFMISSITRQYTDLPSLLLTPETIHTQLTLDGFDEVFPANSTNRLGLQLTIVSKGEKCKPQSDDTFDDEHAPGLFTTVKYPFGQFKLNSSFLSFKPYAYLTPDRLIAQTIDTIQKEMVELKKKDVFKKNNAFNGFFGNSDYYAYQMNITFGSKGQNFYSKTNHTEFSFVIGLGDLPGPQMSLFIKLVIIIGAGLSILVILAFPISIYLMARKMKSRRENSLLNNQEHVY